MYALSLIALAGAAAAIAMPKVTAVPKAAVAALRERQDSPVPSLAPYVPGPQNCAGEVECLNWLGPYELWCEYINTIGHAGLAFSQMGTSCPPAVAASATPTTTASTTANTTSAAAATKVKKHTAHALAVRQATTTTSAISWPALAPYVPGPQNCSGSILCQDIIGGLQEWCLYFSPGPGSAGMALTPLWSSCAPTPTPSA